MDSTPEEINPTTLIEHIKSDPTSGWDAFFKRYDTLIRAVVSWSKWRLPPERQQDVAQKIRTEIVKSLLQFRETSNLESFIKKICIHRCIDEVRKQVRERQTFVSSATETTHDLIAMAETPEDSDPLSLIMAAEKAKAMRQLLSTMDETCRTAIMQFYFDGLSYAEMAELNNVSINTIGSRLSKCLVKLKKMMEKESLLTEEILPPNDYTRGNKT